MSKAQAQLLLEKRLDLAGKSPNYLTMVIRAHFVIEQLLDAAVKNYTQGLSKELSRLPFAMKIELVAALGAIKKESLPLHRQFNSLRNRLAHNPFAAFTKRDMQEMSSCLSASQKAVVQKGGSEKIKDISKREFLWRCCLAMFAELEIMLTQKVRNDVAMELLMKQVVERAATLPKPGPERAAEFHAKVEEAMKTISLLDDAPNTAFKRTGYARRLT